MKSHAKPSERRGTSVVEFAVCLPVVVTILLASVELGRGIQVNQVIQEASQAGCRVYAVKDTTKAHAEAVIATAMQNAGIAEGSYQVEFSPETKADMSVHMAPVTVTITTNYDQIAWLAGDFLAGATITGRSTLPADLEIIADYTPINPLIDIADEDSPPLGDNVIPVDDDVVVIGDDDVDDDVDVDEKELEKEAEKAAKAAEKVAKDAQKAAEKAAKDAEKAAEKKAKDDAKKKK